MRYFENHNANYITTFGKAVHGGETITEERYTALVDIMGNAPQETDTTGYRLRTDLTWEPYEKEPIPDPSQEELSDFEAIEILLGGAS